MLKFIYTLLASQLLVTVVIGQEQNTSTYQNFPLIVSIQFHGLTLPFKDLGGNLANIGLGIGTEVKHGNSIHGIQQVQVIVYRNKAIGNGILLHTQAVWRPNIGDNGFGEIKGGVGYMYSLRPSTSFKQENGVWKSVGRKGKGLLVVPVGFGGGSYFNKKENYNTAFVGYQMLIVKGYNKSIPILPETLIEAGTHLQTR